MSTSTNPDGPRTRPRFLLLGGLFGALALAAGLAGPLAPASTVQAQHEPRSVLIRLPGVNGTEGYGRVKLIEEGSRTRVIVALHGVEGSEFLPALHTGTCATYTGDPLFPLAPFRAGERSRTTVDLDFDTLTGGGYLVDVHALAGNEAELFDPATALVCGELGEEKPRAEAQPTIAPIEDGEDRVVVVTAPVTGVGPIDGQYWSTITVAGLAALALAFAAVGLDLRRRSILTVAQRRLVRLTGHDL